MKRILLILSLLFLVLPTLMAGDRTEQQMKDAAAKVLNSNLRRAAGNLELKELRSLSKLKIYGYDEGGFAVVTKDDRFVTTGSGHFVTVTKIRIMFNN